MATNYPCERLLVDQVFLLRKLEKLSQDNFKKVVLILDINESSLSQTVSQQFQAIEVLNIQKQKNHGLHDLYEVLMGYPELKSLLKRKEWKKADYQTVYIMHEVLNLNSNQYMSSEDLVRFDCYDLCSINYLWIEHSENRFGFSVQKKIYEEIRGKKRNFDNEAWRKFGDKVGWYKKGKWMDDDNYENG